MRYRKKTFCRQVSKRATSDPLVETEKCIFGMRPIPEFEAKGTHKEKNRRCRKSNSRLRNDLRLLVFNDPQPWTVWSLAKNAC